MLIIISPHDQFNSNYNSSFSCSSQLTSYNRHNNFPSVSHNLFSTCHSSIRLLISPPTTATPPPATTLYI
ncbi:unnamed protein product [Trifolium pratense]|uniref:Uncharacterized protein n=1 Tax=Trifolium pratense TaxID=57577 RepID=A0ACB0IS90_TRIPR|nr:unnamed protein product [Trifolium pratense]